MLRNELRVLSPVPFGERFRKRTPASPPATRHSMLETEHQRQARCTYVAQLKTTFLQASALKVHGSERAAARNSRVVARIAPFLHGNARKTRGVVSLELVEAAGIKPASQ